MNDLDLISALLSHFQKQEAFVEAVPHLYHCVPQVASYPYATLSIEDTGKENGLKNGQGRRKARLLFQVYTDFPHLEGISRILQLAESSIKGKTIFLGEHQRALLEVTAKTVQATQNHKGEGILHFSAFLYY